MFFALILLFESLKVLLIQCIVLSVPLRWYGSGLSIFMRIALASWKVLTMLIMKLPLMVQTCLVVFISWNCLFTSDFSDLNFIAIAFIFPHYMYHQTSIRFNMCTTHFPNPHIISLKTSDHRMQLCYQTWWHQFLYLFISHHFPQYFSGNHILNINARRVYDGRKFEYSTTDVECTIPIVADGAET